MTEQTSKTVRHRCPAWVKVLLGVSLALNLAIFGLIAGLSVRGGPLRADATGFGYAMPYVMALERADRRALFNALRSASDLPDRRMRRAHFEDMMAALRHDPFDRGDVEAVLMRQADAVSQVQAKAQAEWLVVVSEMTPEQRAAYADQIEELLRKGPRRRERPPQN